MKIHNCVPLLSASYIARLYMSALKNSILLHNRKAENRPLMEVICSLLLLAPCLSALMISCCKYFLITVKLTVSGPFCSGKMMLSVLSAPLSPSASFAVWVRLWVKPGFRKQMTDGHPTAGILVATPSPAHM